MKISVTSYKIGHYIKKLISEKKEYTISTLIVIKPPKKKLTEISTRVCVRKKGEVKRKSGISLKSIRAVLIYKLGS